MDHISLDDVKIVKIQMMTLERMMVMTMMMVMTLERRQSV